MCESIQTNVTLRICIWYFLIALAYKVPYKNHHVMLCFYVISFCVSTIPYSVLTVLHSMFLQVQTPAQLNHFDYVADLVAPTPAPDKDDEKKSECSAAPKREEKPPIGVTIR